MCVRTYACSYVCVPVFVFAYMDSFSVDQHCSYALKYVGVSVTCPPCAISKRCGPAYGGAVCASPLAPYCSSFSLCGGDPSWMFPPHRQYWFENLPKGCCIVNGKQWLTIMSNWLSNVEIFIFAHRHDYREQDCRWCVLDIQIVLFSFCICLIMWWHIFVHPQSERTLRLFRQVLQ